MNFSSENHDPLPLDKERLLIPGHLPQSVPILVVLQIITDGGKVRTYIFLQQIPLFLIRMLHDRKAIELMGNNRPCRLRCEQRSRAFREQPHPDILREATDSCLAAGNEQALPEVFKPEVIIPSCTWASTPRLPLGGGLIASGRDGPEAVACVV
jgi:hypothetical protein